MKQTPFAKYPQDKLKPLIEGIPFLADLAIADPQQYDLLLQNAKIIEMKPGDVLIKKGTMDTNVYFLLKGELGIYAEEKISRRSEAISNVTQGRVLGGLAVLAGQLRTATVAADKITGPALLLGIDFKLFGEMDDFSKINLETKLAFSRIVINSTRFKLEGYKAENPNHPLAGVYAKVKKYGGAKDTLEELQYHTRQASMLARLLEKWNEV